MHGEELEQNIDWNLVAAYYDAYVRTDLDRAFFLRHARASGGPVLELMCGTGRITLPLIEAGFQVTGIDSSARLLDRFRAKLAARNLHAELVEADVRSFELGRTFPFVFAGFHSFAEVLGADDRLRAMKAIRRHVAPGGRFVLTLHNPVIRAAAIHEEWRSMGIFPLESGNSVEVSSRWELDRERTRVRGVQRYREVEGEACVNELAVPIAFDLVTPEEVREHARQAGFHIAGVSGTYEGAAFDELASPFALFEMTPS